MKLVIKSIHRIGIPYDLVRVNDNIKSFIQDSS